MNVIPEESWGRIGERESVCERHSRGELGEDRRERECVNVIQEESWGRIGERESVCERHSRGELGEDRRKRERV